MSEQIISINFEELEYEPLLDYGALYGYIKERLCPDRMTYIFLDEVQKVESYEKVVDSLYVKDNIDICITGGMPYVTQMERTPEKIESYLEGIYNTVIVRDIEERQSRRETDPTKRKVSDIALLKTIARYLSSVVGSPVSVKSVSDYLTSSGRKVSPNTVSDYMDALAESFIFYPVERFDVVGKQLLKTNKKWYVVDLGLRNHILPRMNYDLGFSLKNVVYFELLRRGYKVTIGRVGTAEVDFVAQRQGVITYFQVTADMQNEVTFEREMAPLRIIRDNYEKIVLTLDRFTTGNYEGLQVVNVLDWLEG